MNREIASALKHLKSGDTILYPTDTVWGIGCDATNEKAVSKIFRLKNRAESKSLIILVSSLNMIKKYVSVQEKAIKILESSEKPTTIIYQNSKNLAKNTIALDNTIAIRIVKDEFCRKLIKRLGKPIVSTSANVSGKITPKSFLEIDKQIIAGVTYVVKLNQDKIADKPSRILKIVNNKIEVLRA